MRMIDNMTSEQINVLKLKGMLSEGRIRLQHDNCQECLKAAAEQLETNDYYEPNEEQPYRLRDEGRNDDGTGESYAERNH